MPGDAQVAALQQRGGVEMSGKIPRLRGRWRSTPYRDRLGRVRLHDDAPRELSPEPFAVLAAKVLRSALRSALLTVQVGQLRSMGPAGQFRCNCAPTTYPLLMAAQARMHHRGIWPGMSLYSPPGIWALIGTAFIGRGVKLLDWAAAARPWSTGRSPRRA